MERFLKYLAGFLVIFSFCLIIYASEEEIDKAKEAMEKYCQQDTKDIKGCIYDPNDTMYTQSGAIHNSNYWLELTTPSSLPLSRGYVTANAQGELLFAGCYKGHFDDGDWAKAGDYYAFKIVALKDGRCQEIDNDIVIAKGTKYKKNYFLGIITGWDGEFDGVNPLGEDMATYIDWTATNGGECPIGFGLTANTKWYTRNDHKYVFSNDGKGFNIGVKSFGFFGIGSEEYVTTPGCTVQDKTGHEEAEACFNDAAAKIANTPCPSDYSKLSEISKTLEGYQDSCDSKFRTLYSKGLLESDAKEMEEKLVTAVKRKLTSCQYNQCNITNSQQEKIVANLSKNEYKLCQSGKCPAGNYKNQSNSENAKCYKIGNGTSAYFEWTDKPSGQPASVQNISKSDCYGTYDTKNCRDCLRYLYKVSGLNDTQIKCMLKIEGEKSSIDDQSEKDINEQFDKEVDEKLQENEEIREAAYESYETPDIQIEMPSEDPSVKTCEQILGSNLTKVLKVGITVIQVVGAIIAIVKGMMTLIPPILAKDADALKKASKTLVTMAIILVVIFLFRPLLKFLGDLLDFDTSCII